MVVDHLSDYLDQVRAALTTVVTPVVVIADYPNRTANTVKEVFASRESLQERVMRLEQEQILLRAKTEKMAALTAENNRLRNLLGSAAKLQDNVLVAELTGIDPDPNRHEVLVDKGSNHGVFVGQPVLDAEGLFGQVISVSPLSARVLLISDQSHSIPVQVVRSNLRLIAQVSGSLSQLDLMHIQETADIRPGDLLVSSGLGDRFPTGYPVGIVSALNYDPGRPFALATATPSALLDRSRHVLLVFSEDQIRQRDADG